MYSRMNIPQGIDEIIKSCEEKCDIYDIFFWHENHMYICEIICKLMTNKYHINRFAEEMNVTLCADICDMMLRNSEALVDVIDAGYKKYKLPYPEDIPYDEIDVLYQLDYVNSLFIRNMCITIVCSPSLVIDDYDEIDPVYGMKMEKLPHQQRYSAASFTTGHWDPLEDIKNRYDNKGKSYWEGYRNPLPPVDLERLNDPKKMVFPRRNAEKYSSWA